MSEASKGKPKSSAHKEQLRLARTGCKWSDAEHENRAFMRIFRLIQKENLLKEIGNESI